MKKILLSLFIIISFFSAGSVSAANDTQMYGWSWSDTTGWIRLNSCAGYDQVSNTNTGCSSGGQYAVTINTDTGAMSGYGWSSNLGWIAFSPSSCGAAPTATAVKDAGGVITSYRLTGIAHIVSMVSAPWNISKYSGGYNGCVYLDSASMPSNPCNISFGVNFLGIPVGNPTSYDGGGFAWGAGGSSSAGANCANAGNTSSAWGGLSWIRFDGIFSNSKAKIISQNLSPEVTLSLDGVFNTSCSDSSTVTLRWTAKNATSCKWTAGPGTGTAVAVLANGALSAGVTTFTVGRTTGVNFALECKNSTGTVSTTKTKAATVLAGQCSQCSDGIDNDGIGGADAADVACHFSDEGQAKKRCKLTDPYRPEFSPESQTNCTGSSVCQVGDPGYPACKNRAIPKIIEN
jgi:hypothetical protein